MGHQRFLAVVEDIRKVGEGVIGLLWGLPAGLAQDIVLGGLNGVGGRSWPIYGALETKVRGLVVGVVHLGILNRLEFHPDLAQTCCVNSFTSVVIQASYSCHCHLMLDLQSLNVLLQGLLEVGGQV